MLDLQRMKHAIAVANAGQYSEAANIIPMSQSALSRSIQTLERQYGIRIFERGRSGAVLTPDGAKFISYAEDLVRHAEAAERDLQLLAKGTHVPTRFGLGPVSASAFLPTLLRKIMSRPEAPTVRVVVGSNATLRHLLRSAEIEFYLGGLPLPSESDRLGPGYAVRQVAGPARVVLLVRDGHPLLDGPLTRDRLATYPVLAGSFVRQVFPIAELADLGIREPTIELDNYEILADLTRDSDAILIGGAAFAEGDRLGLRGLSIDISGKSQSFSVIAHSTERRLTPLAAELIEDLISMTDTGREWVRDVPPI
ncbi:LysR family transcriptional regulator [Rhodococcus sp. 5G237]